MDPTPHIDVGVLLLGFGLVWFGLALAHSTFQIRISSWGGQNNTCPAQRRPHPNPGICKYITLQAKGLCRWGEFLNGPSVITRVFKSGREESKRRYNY